MPSVTLTDGIDPISIARGAYEGEPNPHAWMGLDNALIYVDNIAAAFAEHDPDNAETYLANAEAYKAEIARHDRSAARAPSPRSRKTAAGW